MGRFAAHDVKGYHLYPMIPTGSSVGAVSPWHITGDRIPCTFAGFVTADSTIRCDGQEQTLEDYQLFEVVVPGGAPPSAVSIHNVTWQDEDDDSEECQGQDVDGVPESGEFGAFNIHLRNTGATDIDDQACDVRVLNSTLGNTVDSDWHDYPPIPAGSSVGAVSPWHITGGRIPCTFTGFVTADITIRCDGQEQILEDYQLFEVVDPG